MDNIGKPKVKGYACPWSKWVGDGLRAPYCGVCGGLHIEYHDMPGCHCECDEADTMEVMDGVALMLHTAPEDSDDDDEKLPMYACALYNNVMVLGGGGTLACTTCRSQHVFKVGDNVALLGLHTKGFNHRQGVVVCKRDDRYGVLLVGTSEPIAVRPVNMRTIIGTPVYRERPQEQEAANIHGTAFMLRTAPNVRGRAAQVVACLGRACEGIGRVAVVFSEFIDSRSVHTP